jgi:transcriptional regulator with XRE-family HTH domain
MEIQELGARIKRIRKARGLTLKDIEARSQVSATHISEIERGKTSPTIGALSRIAAALGKDTAFFLETQNLDDVSRIKYEDRVRTDLKTTRGYYQHLSHGIPGGRLQVYRLHLEGGASLQYTRATQEGEATVLCEQGDVDFVLDTQTFTLHTGDSIHFTEVFRPRIVNRSASEGLDLCLISMRRHSLSEL